MIYIVLTVASIYIVYLNTVDTFRKGVVALVVGVILATSGYNVSKVSKVSANHFMEVCGYEMPQYDDVVVVDDVDSILKLSMGATKMVSDGGYQRGVGDKIYIKVVNPISMMYAPFLEVNCLKAKLQTVAD